MTATTHPLRLVLPIDRTSAIEEAVTYAKAIALPGDEMLFLSAIDLGGINPVVMPKSVSVNELRARVMADAEQEMNLITAGVIGPDDVTIRTLVEDGSPAEIIIKNAPNAETSLIIMPSHGRGAIGRLTYGSVADRVARTSHAPVLLIRFAKEGTTLPEKPIQRLVVPLDGSTRSEKSLPTAIALAKRLAVPIQLVAVSEVERMAAIYGATLSAAAYGELSDEAETELMKSLESVADRVAAEGVPVKLQVLSGAVAAAIESVTEPGDVIVMTSHGRGGMRRLILGSVAEQLGRTASVPVLLVPSM